MTLAGNNPLADRPEDKRHRPNSRPVGRYCWAMAAKLGGCPEHVERSKRFQPSALMPPELAAPIQLLATSLANPTANSRPAKQRRLDPASLSLEREGNAGLPPDFR